MEQKQSTQNNDVCWIRGKCIGQGSFGTVNLASNKSKGILFAVKSVDFSSCRASQIEALENEIRILRSLNSPYIIQYLDDDVSYESSTHYRNLHLEYLPTGTIADSATNVDESTIQSYTYCIVSALKYLHSRGFVHCDVKGKNVLITESGQAKLADFGSAVEIRRAAKIIPRGSPLWMAPEVLRQESQGPESDVWSLGCTVIEMITGKPAWEIGFIGSIPEIPNRISKLGRDFLNKCLKKDPNQRWSCDQLLHHPYISSVAARTASELSPRCVLDWFSDHDENEDEEMKLSEDVEWARDRIGKLAMEGGVNWESEGWVEVRGSERETTWVNSDETLEMGGTSSEVCRAELEFLNSGCREFCGACGDKLGWRCGSQKVAVCCNMFHIGFTIFRYFLICWLIILLYLWTAFIGLKLRGCHSHFITYKYPWTNWKKKYRGAFVLAYYYCASSDAERNVVKGTLINICSISGPILIKGLPQNLHSKEKIGARDNS